MHRVICVPNLVQIGRYLDIEMKTQLERSQDDIISESQNDRMTVSQTYNLLVISLLGRSEKPRNTVSAQSEKIT